MGRTLHYSVTKIDKGSSLSDEDWAKVQTLADKYNSEHNWTCENIWTFERGRDSRVWKEKIAHGFTKVADNEWNAKLVVDFIVEASKLIPYATLSVSDEGDYILIRNILVKDGKVTPDAKAIADYMRHCKNHSQYSWSREQVVKINQALESKKYFADVNQKDYENHPEFRTITMSS